MTSQLAPFREGSKDLALNRRIRRILLFLKKPVIAAAVLTLLNPVAVEFVFGTFSRNTLVLVFLFEGGLGLIGGTAIGLSSTPSVSKFGEMTIGTAPWSREGERNAERVAAKWIVASTLIILAGFGLSVV